MHIVILLLVQNKNKKDTQNVYSIYLLGNRNMYVPLSVVKISIVLLYTPLRHDKMAKHKADGNK